MEKKPAKKKELKIGDIVFINKRIEEDGERACSWDVAGKMQAHMDLQNSGEIVDIYELGKYGPRITVKFNDREYWTFMPECLSAKPGKKGKVAVVSLSAITNAAKKKAGQWGPAGVSNFILIDKDGAVTEHKGTICHAAVYRHYNNNAAKKMHTMIDSLCNVKEIGDPDTPKYKATKRYITDLIKESPWADAYKTRTFETAIKSGMEYKANTHIDILAGAIVALRECTEFQNTTAGYIELRDKGFSFATAYIISRFIVFGAKGWQPVAGYWNSNHRTLVGGMDYKEVIKFFKEGYVIPKEREGFTFAEGCKSYWKVQDAIAKCKGEGLQETFFGNLVVKRDKVGFGGADGYAEEDILNLAKTLEAHFE